jgi:hypothetical protein
VCNWVAHSDTARLAGLETCDTADLEVCGTSAPSALLPELPTLQRFFRYQPPGRGPCSSRSPRCRSGAAGRRLRASPICAMDKAGQIRPK